AHHRAGGNARPRGPFVLALGHPARPADDDLAPQRRQPGRRLHVDRERPHPRRHRRQGHAAGGRDQRRLFHPGRADRDRHLSLPHPRALRDRRHSSAARAPRGATVNQAGVLIVAAILVIPALGAAVLALVPFLIVDDLNVVFIILSTLVGFTTSVFSGSYIAHELETGHLTHAYLRFYHAMYQMLMFGMNLALLSNNVGLMWVAVELATLTTVVM